MRKTRQPLCSKIVETLEESTYICSKCYFKEDLSGTFICRSETIRPMKKVRQILTKEINRRRCRTIPKKKRYKNEVTARLMEIDPGKKRFITGGQITGIALHSITYSKKLKIPVAIT